MRGSLRTEAELALTVPHKPTVPMQREHGLLALQRQAGNAAVASLFLQREEQSSFPEGAEEKLRAQTYVQRQAVPGAGAATATVQREALAVQRVGGPTVGRLCVRSNVVSEGLTAGHAWLSYTPTGGSETTYGTWGNRNPIGLHRDLEVGFSHKASRCKDIDAAELTALDTFATSNNAWSLTNNCASFAGRGWAAVTGESLSYTSWGIPNPSALGAGISAAGPTYAAPGPAAGRSGGGSSL